jgi:hypothetical protein
MIYINILVKEMKMNFLNKYLNLKNQIAGNPAILSKPMYPLGDEPQSKEEEIQRLKEKYDAKISEKKHEFDRSGIFQLIDDKLKISDEVFTFLEPRKGSIPKTLFDDLIYDIYSFLQKNISKRCVILIGEQHSTPVDSAILQLRLLHTIAKLKKSSTPPLLSIECTDSEKDMIITKR